MKLVAPGPLVAGLSLCLACFNADAADVAGFDPASSQSIRDVPVHIVLLNDNLKVQIAFQYQSLDPMLTQNMINSTPGMSTGAGIAAGAVGGAIASAIINASLREAAEDQVEPAYEHLQKAQCVLPSGSALVESLERSVRASSWGATTPLHKLTLVDGQSVQKAVDAKSPRHMLIASYSLTPDFSSVVTSVSASVYSDAVPDAPKRWQSKPAWSNQLLVFSDQMQVPDKTEQDIGDAVAAEQARYAGTPAAELIAKANAGDTRARKKAMPLIKAHERAMREARNESWTAAQAAAWRSRQWTSSQCAPLALALEQNNRELAGLLTRLHAGALPELAAAQVDPVAAQTETTVSVGSPGGDRSRTVVQESAGVYVSRLEGDHSSAAFLHSWYTP